MEPKGKEPLKSDSIPPKSQDSVYYAKEKKKTAPGPLIQSGAGNGAVPFLQAVKTAPSLCMCAYAVCMLCIVSLCTLCVYVWYVVYVCTVYICLMYGVYRCMGCVVYVYV